ncbi:MAG: RNA methyltransferase [Puniceicoccales bacterium]|jgi:TrmH family RNA methyltransferase|nr:RNA methyltransferase [Puniceicoccales bacterium]
MIERITSKQNDRIKFLCKLRDRAKRKRHGMFLIEGNRELSRALGTAVKLDTVFFCEKFFRDASQSDLVAVAAGKNIPICEVSGDVFEKISNRENCDGVIALANFWQVALENVKLSENPLVLIAEGIEKSGNLGALMRSAESAGVDALILCNPVTDIFNPNVVRASQGAVFSLPIAVASNGEVSEFLQKNSIKIFAATPAAEALYFDENFTGSVAIAVGSEHDGLSSFWLKNSGVKKISLPQMGSCDSLNVNDAAVVILYEVLRQRRSK